ncbi:MAG TPA: glycogen-binding domain-containing protein [Candidatus Paceibacterota bacterium]|nr:glycogen-binding domain-containing protein [Candidatus Paceibacterota bacterium]
MKKDKTNHQPAGEPRSKPARIEFAHATATAVRIAGTFNDWRPEATPMISLGEGRWAKELTLPPGTYEYCVVVDGAWMADPLAKETVPNPFGGLNSVLRVAAPA